jgi:hypothetical protein
VIKLPVNGELVNGISRASRRAGSLCMESEGSGIHLRDGRIMELPPAVTAPAQAAPERR